MTAAQARGPDRPGLRVSNVLVDGNGNLKAVLLSNGRELLGIIGGGMRLDPATGKAHMVLELTAAVTVNGKPANEMSKPSGLVTPDGRPVPAQVRGMAEATPSLTVPQDAEGEL